MNEATKLCECGCGQPAPIAASNHTKHGYIKGKPLRFIKGHNARGAGAPWWKGDEASYHALHRYLRQHFPKTGVCEECGTAAGTTARTDYALIHGREYSRNREDYRELCHQCHMRYDNTGRHHQKHELWLLPAPSCKCGCGEPVVWSFKKNRWKIYAAGHYRKAMV